MQNKKLSQLVECSICCETLRDPVALPCLHVFCRTPCLNDWTKKGNHVCPLCRAQFSLNQMKPFHFLKNFLEEVETTTTTSCSDCFVKSTEIIVCEHCNAQVCNNCSARHMQTLREEVAELCDVLNSETGILLEQQNEKIVLRMSKITAEKAELKLKLQNAHDAILTQISDLHQRSIKILSDIEEDSRRDTTNKSSEIDALLKRIDHICESTANLGTERDMRSLMKLDSEITQLQNDIVNFQLKESSKDLKNTHLDREKISLKNVKINQAYKNIVAQIEETDMLRKVI